MPFSIFIIITINTTTIIIIIIIIIIVIFCCYSATFVQILVLVAESKPHGPNQA